MSHRQRVRSMVVACGAILVVGSGVLTVAPAGAAPDPNFPLGNSPGVPNQQSPEKRLDKVPEKTEKLGGSATGKLLDLGEYIIKCGLNIATPTVKCE
ncbi:hypothetical protein BJY24_001175 [Nocardia transvalensis]|uniref:Uncharacterized protein n=1 Tax=Nocardia transvalensis TaxID=37333 RepID=A0A7W9PAQ9_9NOCA|nr:hypothetical protein [Nocardia transvalensis]MBB5912308.1 hypothetical protein [Nocardia transvalensis]